MAAALSRRLGSRPVHAAFLEHEDPSAPEVVGACSSAQVTVLPLFLSKGYHVRHDVPAAVAASGEGVRGRVGATDPPLMTEDASWTLAAIVDSSMDAGLLPDPAAAVVVVTAGSSDPDVLQAWDLAAARWTRRGPWNAVRVAHASGPGLRPREVCGEMRAQGDAVQALVPALVARGFFADRIVEEARALGVACGGLVGTSEPFLQRLAWSCE